MRRRGTAVQSLLFRRRNLLTRQHILEDIIHDRAQERSWQCGCHSLVTSGAQQGSRMPV